MRTCSDAPAEVFGHSGGNRGGTTLGQNDTVDAGAIGSAQESSEVVRIFDAVEGEEEAVGTGFSTGGEEVLDSEEGALTDKGENALVGVGMGHTGELVAGLKCDADVGGAAEFGEALQGAHPGARGRA